MKLAGATLLLAGTSLAAQKQTPLNAATSSAPPYRDQLVLLHKALVEIPSISFTEQQVGRFLLEYLEGLDFTTAAQFLPLGNASNPEAHDPGRFNVLAWPGRTQHTAPQVLVTSHIDTVPPFIPYSRSTDEISGDTLLAGRGSVDDVASLAAQVIAVTELIVSGEIDPSAVMLLFVVGEERSGDGMRWFSDNFNGTFKAAIFGEPTEGKLACGHKGIFGCEITAHGVAGHSGYPWLGKSATEVLMRGLTKVLDADLGSSELFGNTTVNVGTIEGGVAPNVIAEEAKAAIAVRVALEKEHGGAKTVMARIKAILESVDKDAFEMDCNEGYDIVKADCDVPGFEKDTMNYGTDVPNLKGNHTRYLYGPGTILVAHGPNEAIKLADMESSVEDYKKLILYALNKDGKEDVGEL
ncbi:Zn-dependent exopeptidase [Nemania sp. FL0031]|nr:Zn-dependent exopeptidase [Nemania sp. FL0031]